LSISWDLKIDIKKIEEVLSNIIFIATDNNLYYTLADVDSNEFTIYVAQFDAGALATDEYKIYFYIDGNTNPTGYVTYSSIGTSINTPIIISFPSVTNHGATYLPLAGKTYQIAIENTVIRSGTKTESNVILIQSSNTLCLTENTRVLTPSGYIRAKDLNKFDYVTTADGRSVIVKHIHHSEHFDVGVMEAPFFVPANAIGENIPSHDIKLSPDHLVLVGNDIWLSPRHMAKRSNKIEQQNIGETIHYYNIMTPNYSEDNLVIEDGVVVESCGYRRTEYDTNVDAYRRVLE